MIWWIVGIWFFVMFFLSFFFGMKGLIHDPDWGVFIAAMTAVWPLVIGALVLLVVGIIPFGIIYILVLAIGRLGRNAAVSYKYKKDN